MGRCSNIECVVLLWVACSHSPLTFIGVSVMLAPIDWISLGRSDYQEPPNSQSPRCALLDNFLEIEWFVWWMFPLRSYTIGICNRWACSPIWDFSYTYLLPVPFERYIQTRGFTRRCPIVEDLSDLIRAATFVLQPREILRVVCMIYSFVSVRRFSCALEIW